MKNKHRKLISQQHPILYFLAVWTRRLQRYSKWYLGKDKYANHIQKNNLPYRIKKHQSILLKRLGDSDMQLQVNKVTNLRVAIQKLNGIIVRPGETFSFYKQIGLPTRKKGYLPGMELSFGKTKSGIGGGLCQISNMLHWLVIHSPLTVTERYHHSFDPFPDDGRVLPFGSGATVFYNYRDYQFTNNTQQTFQINLWITDKFLEGELRVNEELEYSYHIIEKEHEFLRIENAYYRKNEIWREKISKKTGNIIETELITKNFARVIYVPEKYKSSLVNELPPIDRSNVHLNPDVHCE